MEFFNSQFNLGLLFLAVLFLAWGAFRWRRGASRDVSLLILQKEIEQLRTQLDHALNSNAERLQAQLGQVLGHVSERLRENSESMQHAQQSLGSRMDSATRVVGEVQRSLGTLDEANRKIYEVGRDIASLHEILRAPKLRGGLGEYFLEDLLGQILPAEHFSMQHRFRSGEKVDAVIRIGACLVPVDAKFPLENFRRMLDAPGDDEKAKARRQLGADIRRHVDAIATKYILPDEGTYDFALMYIPAEAIYYETVVKDYGIAGPDLGPYALAKRVIPVSPNTLYAYLQAIVMGLKGMKMEDQAKQMVQYLGRLQGDFTRLRDEFALVGKHLTNAQSSFQACEKRVENFGQKLHSANLGSES